MTAEIDSDLLLRYDRPGPRYWSVLRARKIGLP